MKMIKPFRIIVAVGSSTSSSKLSCSLQHARYIHNTFHKRPLPPSLVALSSPQGKLLFRQALDLGGMECYFPLSEQFITQSEPSFCSISSLAMVLNALNHDPKKVWKAPWRWVSEETLQCESMEVCGHSLDKVRSLGLSFREFESLAGCHGVNIKSFPVEKRDSSNSNHSSSNSDSNNSSSSNNNSDCSNSNSSSSNSNSLTSSSSNSSNSKSSGIDHFRYLVDSLSSNPVADTFAVVNFCRQRLGQTGSGHFSPIGGYHRDLDLVLVLDVARFKYPPFWVPLKTLWEGMEEKDSLTGECRGYFVISAQESVIKSLKEDASHSSHLNNMHRHPLSNNSHTHNHDHGHSHHHDHNSTCTHNHSRDHHNSNNSKSNQPSDNSYSNSNSNSSQVHIAGVKPA